MIADNARAAMRFEITVATEFAPDGYGAVVPGHVRRHRALLARHAAQMLGVPPTHVAVTDDPIRVYGPRAADIVTVADPDPDPDGTGPDGTGPDGAARLYRFLTRPGTTDSALLLLDACPMCAGGPVPVAEIETLADLGRYLATSDIEPATDPGPGPTEVTAPPVPIECHDDPGHRHDCPYRTPHQPHRSQPRRG